MVRQIRTSFRSSSRIGLGEYRCRNEAALQEANSSSSITATMIGRFYGALQLLESPQLDKPLTTYSGPPNPEVEKISHTRDTVWLDKAETRGFRGVPEAVWSFHVGGYQVCEKWLKYCKGRTLAKDDIDHYHKIVVALSETIRLMKEIDALIDTHGGWPGAFSAGSVDPSSLTEASV
jgi:hypothetical protein